MTSPTPADSLFVYGTLRPGADHPMAAVLAEASTHLGPACFQGRLYRVSWYPCVVPSDSPADRVLGDVFSLHPTSADDLLRRLDLYEGAQPRPDGPALYRRERRPVVLDSGRSLDVWIYLFNRPVDRLERIPSGDFLAP
jgi:gamma-glutamylcyclotransferase (GGCT)/AIG2-like uncharacterized protein YtfP